MNDIETEFRKIFGDMYLSSSETALHIFELGYKAGAAAENESCAKLVENYCGAWDDEGYALVQAIRERAKS